MRSYQQYRNDGQGWLVAFTLSTHPALWYGSAAIFGAIVAFVR